jgi:hypothetical protein
VKSRKVLDGQLREDSVDRRRLKQRLRGTLDARNQLGFFDALRLCGGLRAIGVYVNKTD